MARSVQNSSEHAYAFNIILYGRDSLAYMTGRRTVFDEIYYKQDASVRQDRKTTIIIILRVTSGCSARRTGARW